jgi:hypothetical protein
MSRLTAFDSSTLSASARNAIAFEKLTGHSMSILFDGGLARAYVWSSINAEEMTRDLLRLLPNTDWIASTCAAALCTSPCTDLISADLSGRVRTMGPRNRMLAIEVLIKTSQDQPSAIVLQFGSADPMTRAIAAACAGEMVNDPSSAAVLEAAFSDPNKWVQYYARHFLDARAAPSDLVRLGSSVLALPSEPWQCLRCRTLNTVDRSSCTQCNVVGPDLEASVQKLAKP